ncbi:MAG TPA: cytochrome P450 [Polyangiaceae bacterium]|jgi:cytochrome P450|nr:cytochrome P450 [Polyangiaceae bacterium]
MTMDGNGGPDGTERERIIALLEARKYSEAIAELKSRQGLAAQEDLDLLAVAHFMLAEFDTSAKVFDGLAKEEKDPRVQYDLTQRARLARANLAAMLPGATPNSPPFSQSDLLSPPSVTDNDFPEVFPRRPNSLRRRLYGFAGNVMGKVLDRAWETLTPVATLRAKRQKSIWTTWDQQSLYPGLFTLAYMRDQLEKHNLKNPYPKGELTAFQKPLTAPSATAVFRTPDGSWNDPVNSREGSADVRFPRNVDPSAAWPDRDMQLDEPSVARISAELLARPDGVMKEIGFLNLLAAAWVQFMVHDWVSHRTHAPDAPREQTHVVHVPPNLPLRERYRQSDMLVGKTMSDPSRRANDVGTPPTTINEVTSWWDGSQVYGSDAKTVASLRSHIDGKLKLDGEYLPTKDGTEQVGYNRNWWVGLSLLHTLFVKEHNAICDELKAFHATWDDDRLFQTARLVNAAVMAKVHTVEWTPAILPNPTLKAALEANWYGLMESRIHRRHRKVLRRVKIDNGVFGGLVGNPVEKYGVPYGLSEEFVEVYRLHELLPDHLPIHRIAVPGAPIDVSLAETRGNLAPVLVKKHGIADLLYSFGLQSPGKLELHNYPQTLREIAVPGAAALDVAAIDVLRARERGVPRYNTFRRQLGLEPIRDFKDLTDDQNDIDALRRLYGNVEMIDMQVGTRAEQKRPKDFGFGETLFQIFILNASRRLQADHFFTDGYNAETYTQEGLDWIDRATFKSILLRHYPELELTGLKNVENAFEPWDTSPVLSQERHPLAYIDQPGPIRRAVEGSTDLARAAANAVKIVATDAAKAADGALTRARAVLKGASLYDPLPPGSFGLPLLGESLEFLGGPGPFLEKRYKEYGPVFKTHIAFEPTVCFGGKDAYSFFLREDLFSRVDGAPKNVQWLFNPRSLSFKDGPEHEKIQKALLSAFEDEPMSSYMPVLNQLLSLSIARWERAGRLTWLPELETLSFAIIQSTFMGAPPSVERGFWSKQFDRLTKGVVTSIASPELYVALAVRLLFKGYVSSVVSRKRVTPGNDVVSKLLAESEQGRIDEAQLQIELVHFFLAGAPLESALAYHLLLLARNPGIREKARAEVLRIAPSGDISLEQLLKLKYVLNTCRESRRAARLVPNTFFAKVKKSFVYRDYYVPAGWRATAMIGATQHDAAVFGSPEKYDPERFATGCPTYVAHGGANDPHRCIGERFSDIVMTLLTARLLQHYTWELVPGQDLSPRSGKVAPVPNGGLEVLFHPFRPTPQPT